MQCKDDRHSFSAFERCVFDTETLLLWIWNVYLIHIWMRDMLCTLGLRLSPEAKICTTICVRLWLFHIYYGLFVMVVTSLFPYILPTHSSSRPCLIWHKNYVLISTRKKLHVEESFPEKNVGGSCKSHETLSASEQHIKIMFHLVRICKESLVYVFGVVVVEYEYYFRSR